MNDASGNEVLRFDTSFAVLDVGGAGGEGDVRVRDGSGNVTIHLDGASGNVITGGGDCAEDFAVDPFDQLEPGTVVVLDEDEILRASTYPYDRRVAGILSGAGGAGPGLILGRPARADDRLPLTLTGRGLVQDRRHLRTDRVGRSAYNLLDTRSRHDGKRPINRIRRGYRQGLAPLERWNRPRPCASRPSVVPSRGDDPLAPQQGRPEALPAHQQVIGSTVNE
jgi:hypothetical protein